MHPGFLVVSVSLGLAVLGREEASPAGGTVSVSDSEVGPWNHAATDVAFVYFGGSLRATRHVWNSHWKALHEPVRRTGLSYRIYLHAWARGDNVSPDDGKDAHLLLRPDRFQVTDDKQEFLEGLTFSDYFDDSLGGDKGANNRSVPDVAATVGEGARIMHRPTFDAVIPVGPHDHPLLPTTVHYARQNIVGLDRVYVISKSPESVPRGCHFVHEGTFPFKLEDMRGRVLPGREGWYLQQLLKLHAWRYIPGLSGRYLVLDADTFFLRRTEFITEDNRTMLTAGSEFHRPYFAHLERLLPGLHRVRNASGISHHMVFDSGCLAHLMELAEMHHGSRPFWQTFIQEADPALVSGASEYELYFNFMQLYHSGKIRIRALEWTNAGSSRDPTLLDYDFITCHHHMCEDEWRILRNHLCALESLKRAFQLVLDDETLFATPKHLVFVRPDVRFLSRLDVEDLRRADDNNAVVLPHDHAKGAYDEAFAIAGSWRAAEAYATRIDWLKQFRAEHGRIILKR